jgi:drug/metabolite transporter (DMT)-like permease
VGERPTVLPSQPSGSMSAMRTPHTSADPPLWGVIVAFAAIYLIWGSTYLAIRFAIETLPPFSMAAVRFTVAGVILYGIARARAERPTVLHWVSAGAVGTLLLAGGNGGVVWAEQWVPSGLTALIIGTVPLWMVLFDWLFAGAPRPGKVLLAGLVWGLCGVGLLMTSAEVDAGSRDGLLGGLAILGASISWAAGSIYARNAPLPRSPFLATAMQMIAGGLVLALMAVVAGEGGQLHLSAFSMKSILALVYLIVFGALIAFTAYIWLLRVSTPARVSTYAYVNPAVAVFLGWLLANEQLDARAGLAVLIILSAVVLVSVKGGEARRPTSD